MKKRRTTKKSSGQTVPSFLHKNSEKGNSVTTGYTIDEYDKELVGTSFKFTWGREHIQPVQFNGMDIGPYEVTLTLREGESIKDLHDRAIEYLDQIAERDYNYKLPKFLNRIKDAAKKARGYNG